MKKIIDLLMSKSYKKVSIHKMKIMEIKIKLILIN